MKTFRATFTYKEESYDESYDELYDGANEEDIEFEIESLYEANAFYDYHYVTDLELNEINVQ